MKILVNRKLWAKSGTWDLPGSPNCIGGYTMNFFGFPMKKFKDGSLEPSASFFDLAQDKICKEHGFDMSFQSRTTVLNDTKDEAGLIDLYASKGIELVFED